MMGSDKIGLHSDGNRTLDIPYQKGELIRKTQNVAAAETGDDLRSGNEELIVPKSVING